MFVAHCSCVDESYVGMVIRPSHVVGCTRFKPCHLRPRCLLPHASLLVERNDGGYHDLGRNDEAIHFNSGSSGFEPHTSLSGDALAMQAPANVMPRFAMRRSNVIVAAGAKNKAGASAPANARRPEQAIIGGERTKRRT